MYLFIFTYVCVIAAGTRQKYYQNEIWIYDLILTLYYVYYAI